MDESKKTFKFDPATQILHENAACEMQIYTKMSKFQHPIRDFFAVLSDNNFRIGVD